MNESRIAYHAPVLTQHDLMAQISDYLEREFLYMRAGVELDPDAGLQETGVIDSLGVLELIGYLESTFEITIADDEITLANLGTVRSIAQFVTRARTSGE
jgi:acyl carrier protein